jgi:DNA-binding NarL/FixJ family response regulator
MKNSTFSNVELSVLEIDSFPCECQQEDICTYRRGDRIDIVLIENRPLYRECFAIALSSLSQDINAVSSPLVEEILGKNSESIIKILALGGAQLVDPAVQCAMASLRLASISPFIVLADVPSFEDAVEALKQGARGYVTSDLPLKILLEAIRLVRSGGVFITPDVICQQEGRKAPALNSFPPQSDASMMLNGMTAREFEVLNRLQQGKSNKLIALELNLRENTVKVHVQAIMRKLGATSRAEVGYLTRNLLNGEGSCRVPR